MALTFIGTGCGQGVLYCPLSPQETTNWNNGRLPIGEQRATIRAWAKICPLPFFNCHFFTVTEVLSLRRLLSECSLTPNQNKTKQKHFLSLLHRQNYLHAAACHIFSLRRTDPCHPCKRFGEKTSQFLQGYLWDPEPTPVYPYFSREIVDLGNEKPHLSDVKRTFMEEENKVSQYSAFSIKSNGRSVRWAYGVTWSHGAKGRFSFARFCCTPLLYSWSTQGKWKESPPPLHKLAVGLSRFLTNFPCWLSNSCNLTGPLILFISFRNGQSDASCCQSFWDLNLTKHKQNNKL